MLTLFRKFAKSPWAIGLLVLLAIGLLVTGGSQADILGTLQPAKVIKAGDRSLSPQEFRTMMDGQLKGIQQQQGRAVTYEEALGQSGALTNVLRSQSEQLGFFAWAWKTGIRPGNELVLRLIRGEQAFFDPITRQFSEQAYEAKLAEINVTPKMLEQQFRDNYIQLHYGSAITAGIRLPRIYGAVVANQTQQTRDGRWFVLTQAMAGTAGTPTDAQLNSFMSQNAASLRSPELRTGTLIVFSNPADQTITITDEKIQERFEFRKDALSLPERRTFTTLTAPTRAAADRIAAALRAGQTPSAVGQANDLQPAEYADTPRSAIGDPAVAGAVFGLGVDQVSAPVQARVGFVVAKVTSVTAGREVTLADVRDQIVEELRGQEARAAIANRVEAYETARREGKSLDVAVREVGATLVPIPAVSQDGRNAERQQLRVPADVLEAMWDLTKGRASEVLGVGEGQFIVVRVDDIIPPAMPALDTIRADLTRAWINRENARLMSARSDALTARLRAGEDIAAVAASVNAPLVTRAGLKQTEESVQQVGEGVVVGMFRAERNQPFSRPQPDNSFVIGRVDRITAPTAALAVNEAQQWRDRLAQATAQPLLQAAIAGAAQKSKAEYDEPLARQALGLEAAPATPAAPAGQ